VPALHCVHAAELAALKVPVGHAVHDAALAFEYVPALHVEHADAPEPCSVFHAHRSINQEKDAVVSSAIIMDWYCCLRY
jgi:hypothetical protein